MTGTELTRAAVPPQNLRRTKVGGAVVSTTFLGQDHNYSGEGPPVPWETLVFGAEYDGSEMRHTSEETALSVHDLVVKHLREKLKRENGL